MILIAGGSGQLGHALTGLAKARGLDFRAVSRPELDFAAPDSIDACFAAAQPSLVINAAAYTAVDAAEAHRDAALAGNVTGPQRLAQLCAGAGIPFIHVSTDYVFDGAKGAPYVETDPTAPTGVYGETKLQGEQAVLATVADAIVLRTAWVYGAYGKNFVRTMLQAGAKLPQLRVVADQRGTPTAAPELARVILDITDTLRRTGWRAEYRGIFHVTGAGETTWHGFATAIFAAAAAAGYNPPALQAITTADWPTPAHRPADSRLDCRKLARVFGITLPDWHEHLGPIVQQLLSMDMPN